MRDKVFAELQFTVKLHFMFLIPIINFVQNMKRAQNPECQLFNYPEVAEREAFLMFHTPQPEIVNFE
jgi:hypothetical protein